MSIPAAVLPGAIPDNIVGELARLNRLLNDHPCFFDNAALTRLSPPDSPVFALRRVSGEGADSVLVLVNNDTKLPQKISLGPEAFPDAGKLAFELAGSAPPKSKKLKSGEIEFSLEPGAAHCLSADPNPRGLSGDDYRNARAQAAWALTALGHALPVEQIPAFEWRDLARIAKENPAALLAACSSADAETVRLRLERLRCRPCNAAGLLSAGGDVGTFGSPPDSSGSARPLVAYPGQLALPRHIAFG